MSRGLLHTSVVIAVARGEQVELPEESAISIITLCGLHHGVLVADDRTRPGRLATLAMVERSFEPLPVDSRVAPHYGALIARAREGKGGRPRTADALIAATALSHGLPLYSRDRDFARLALPGLVLV
ncbi:MAG: PIN domain-containing protein [Solirubrobacterales bacterium]